MVLFGYFCSKYFFASEMEEKESHPPSFLSIPIPFNGVAFLLTSNRHPSLCKTDF